MKNNKTFYQSQTFEWFRLKSALHIWIYNYYEVIPHGHSDPPLSPSPRLNHGSRQAGRLPGRDWELLSWGSKKQQKEKVFEAITLVFIYFIINLYYTREALRNPKNEWSALCLSRLSGEQGELQDLTSKRPCCADRFESNWSGQTRQTPDGLEVLAKLWSSTWEKPDAQSPA